MNDLNFTTSNTLLHHGILGQKWGVQNGPPYPLSKSEVKRLKKENKKLIKQKKEIDKQNKLLDKNKTLNAVLENDKVTYKQIKEQNRGPAYRKATSLANKATNSATSEAGKKVGAAVGAAVGVILAKEIKDFYNSKRGSFDVSKPVKNIKVDGGAKRKFWQSDIDVNDLNFTTTNSILHHGIEGQKWGVRNGPPYPLDRQENNKKNIKNNTNQSDANDYIKAAKDYDKFTNSISEEYFYKNEEKVRKLIDEKNKVVDDAAKKYSEKYNSEREQIKNLQDKYFGENSKYFNSAYNEFKQKHPNDNRVNKIWFSRNLWDYYIDIDGYAHAESAGYNQIISKYFKEAQSNYNREAEVLLNKISNEVKNDLENSGVSGGLYARYLKNWAVNGDPNK